jgi:hypothetical protein
MNLKKLFAIDGRVNPTLAGCVALLAALSALSIAIAAEEEKPVERTYVTAPPAPASQSPEEAARKSAGCVSCHTASDQKTMHANPAIQIGCTDCHGGDATVALPAGTAKDAAAYVQTRERAHVLPRYPEAWHYPKSANPERTYALLNREAPEFTRFVNPSDYRVVREACGACHADVIEAAVRSMHSTGAMLWGGAAYNNGILDVKNYIVGESYDRNGVGVSIKSPNPEGFTTEQMRERSILPVIYPLPAWETIYPGDVFRVFERGGRNIGTLFPETGIPNSLGLLQRIEEPGRPDFRQSNRGPGTGARIAVPVINITKTRLNDPFTWFLGTNDQPGDYRNSGCASCHVVYANDRDPRHSSVWAKFGRDGQSATVDPTISKEEKGHPIQHAFTRAIPTSQCMICHMHQPNMFVNTFLGYTMWDYEADAPRMWPEKQQYPSIEQTRKVLDRNPEGAAPRGKWADLDFLRTVWDRNGEMKDTQFADYHGHGWNFRAIFKRDRKGNLLDAAGNRVSNEDPDKFRKAVHMSSVHVDVGMQCIDCHFSQDNHGNGYIHGEVAAAVEIDCKDCHGTATKYPNLYTSGPAKLGKGMDLTTQRTPDGRLRFEWVGRTLYQRSMMDPNLEWKLSLVKDSVTPGSADYNEKAARAKLMGRDTASLKWGAEQASNLAHDDDKLECYTCHTSWTTSCGGCHLPIEANWKTERHHFEGGYTRNYATYNPQVARDEMFLLSKREPSAGGKWAPARSSSALVLSSTNSNREKIYIQQPPVAASGYSSQAINPHYPHTERKTETKDCEDCHLSAKGDNNAIMAQLLTYGTKYIDFIGYKAYVGGTREISAIRVTEWDEPQAVIGSYLHRYAYPDWYAQHQQRGRVLQDAAEHSADGDVRCIQLRGEYLFAAEGKGGMRVYDAASAGNKGISQKVITAPFSPLGHDTQIASRNATCVALPTTQPVSWERNQKPNMQKDNLELPMHPLYRYAYIVDAEEGLILTDIGTLADGEPRNNFLKRALTWNPDGVLNGARAITIAGYWVYVSTPRGVVVVNIDDPLKPKVAAQIALREPRGTALQFRYLFATTADGLQVVDVTDPARPRVVPGNTIALADARNVFVARTYAYVAAGKDGMVIVDVTKPEAIVEYQRFTAGGKLVDTSDVVVAMTNASPFAYVADGVGGFKLVQLTSPESQPNFYGFAPEPKPELVASFPTRRAALAVSEGLERDRAVDETGNQVAVFGRRGSRPLSLEEMRRLYLDKAGRPWTVPEWKPSAAPAGATPQAATPARGPGTRGVPAARRPSAPPPLAAR